MLRGINELIFALVPGKSIVMVLANRADASTKRVVVTVGEFLARFVHALPDWVFTAVPPLAALSALVMFLSPKGLQRLGPQVLPLVRLFVIASGLFACALLVVTNEPVALAMCYFVLAMLQVGLILLVVGAGVLICVSAS